VLTYVCEHAYSVVVMCITTPETLRNLVLVRHPATRCNTLQRTATRCNTLQHAASYCNALQHSATHCNTLQRTATYCNALHRTVTHYTQHSGIPRWRGSMKLNKSDKIRSLLLSGSMKLNKSERILFSQSQRILKSQLYTCLLLDIQSRADF